MNVAREAGTLPIVMLHGWGMNLRVFDPLRALLPTRTTRATDLPGHGRSPWPPEGGDFDAQCAAVAQQLPPRCVLLGWSLGAKLALSLAARDPARIAGLVLVSATPKFAQSADWPQGMAPEAMRAFRRVLEQDWRQTLQDFIWLQVRGSQQAEAVAAHLQAVLSQHGEPRREALLAGMQLLESIDLRALAQQVQQPALLIAGRNDRVTPPAAAQWLAGTLPRATLHLLPRAGHAPHLSHPAEVAAAIEDFLAAHAAQPGADPGVLGAETGT